MAAGVVPFVSGCGGAEQAPKDDEAFYIHGGGVIDKNRGYEVYFPKLDHEKTVTLPRYVGVGVLDGAVRFARPIDWSMRDADYTAEKRFISYQSPRQFIFTILERLDPPGDSWSDVEKRYEVETRELGGRILASRQPIGTANGQGRSYLLKTQIKAKPAPFDAYATEILLRSQHRVLLVQVVHQGEVDAIADEVSAALGSMVIY
ncbi:MAG: hypothetical protein U0271_39630 [Polyangiaceae bacterium]